MTEVSRVMRDLRLEANSVGRKMPVVYWEINAKDGEALSKFYEEVFEWDAKVDSTGFHSFKSGDPKGINGGIFTGKGVLPTHRALCVEVDNIEEIVKRVKGLGQEILQGPFESGNAILAFFQDPEGHMIGLIQRK